jgi:uncharacterized protein YbcV (DUF1398 family)
MFTAVKNFRGQDYQQITKDCLRHGILFEDVEFPATSRSAYFSKEDNTIVWQRPKELCKVRSRSRLKVKNEKKKKKNVNCHACSDHSASVILDLCFVFLFGCLFF